MAKIKINGDSSGYVEIAAPNAAHNNTLELGPGTKILTDKNTHTGNIGIGTANAGEKLHLTTTSGNCKLRIDAASAASVEFYNSGTRFSDMFTDAGTGNFTITNRQNADIILRTNGTNERVYIKSSGEVGLGLNPTAGDGALQIAGGLRVAGSASASDTNSPYIYRTSGYDHLNFATSGVERLRILSDGSIRVVADNQKLTLGASNDFELYHDGSNNVIATDGPNIRIGTTGENFARFINNGAVELYYDNTKRFETKSNGTQTTGRIFLNGTNGGFDYNNVAHTLEFLVSNGTTHSELTHNAYVPSASNTRHLGYANKRWATLYVDKIAFGGSANTDQHSLDDYEEGTYTPTYQNFTTTGTSTLVGKYVKVGRQVTVGIKWSCTGTIAYSTSAFISLPFSMTYGQEYNGLIGMLHNSNSTSQTSGKSGVQCKLDGEGGSRFFPGNFTTTSSGESLLFGGTYIAAS